MNPNPCQQLNEWLQKYPGTLQIFRQEGQCSSNTAWYCSSLVIYVPSDHKSRCLFRVYGSAKSKKDIRKLVAERILQLFSVKAEAKAKVEVKTKAKEQVEPKFVLYKHGKLPCSLCEKLELEEAKQEQPVIRLICVAQDFDNGLQRLHGHCQRQGLSLCTLTETFSDVLRVSHPLLPAAGLEFSLVGTTTTTTKNSTVESRLKRKSLAIDRIIQVMNQDLIDAYVAKIRPPSLSAPSIEKMLTKTNITHLVMQSPEHLERLHDWLQEGQQQQADEKSRLVFDTEWDRNIPVILAFCKSATEVLLVRIAPELDKSVLGTFFKQLLQRRTLVCMDKGMEVCALQRWGCNDTELFKDKLVDLACEIARLFPGFSSKAGLLRYSRWFLGWDVSPYKLDFKEMQYKGISWHNVANNEALRNHVTVDCLALWQLMQTLSQ